MRKNCEKKVLMCGDQSKDTQLPHFQLLLRTFKKEREYCVTYYHDNQISTDETKLGGVLNSS